MATATQQQDKQQPQDKPALQLEPIRPNGLDTHPETAADVLAASAKALIQARYLVAYSRPRDMDEVRSKILRDCARPSFAESAIYSKPIGNSSVQGLSVRFAESAQRALTNIMPERVIIFDDQDKRIVRVSMTDLESNVCHSKDLILEKTIERRNSKGRTVKSQRLNSYGEVVYIVEATEDELLVKESAISSKIERQLTLKLLDGGIQDEAIAAIKATQANSDRQDPDAARKKVIDAFDAIGIRVGDLKAFLGGETLDTIQPKEMAQLRAVYQAIRDGETSWKEVMEQRDSARGTATTVEGNKPTSTAAKVKAAAAAAAASKAAPEPKQEAEPEPEPQSEPEPQQAEPPKAAQQSAEPTRAKKQTNIAW